MVNSVRRVRKGNSILCWPLLALAVALTLVVAVAVAVAVDFEVQLGPEVW